MVNVEHNGKAMRTCIDNDSLNEVSVAYLAASEQQIVLIQGLFDSILILEKSIEPIDLIVRQLAFHRRIEVSRHELRVLKYTDSKLTAFQKLTLVLHFGAK